MNIIYDDGPDKAWCDPPCDALLHERKDGSMICTGCCREYLPGSVNKRKLALEPLESPYDDAEMPVVMMSDYTQPQRKKPTILDKEERAWLAQGKGLGRSIT
jgi:hypothetical protein